MWLGGFKASGFNHHTGLALQAASTPAHMNVMRATWPLVATYTREGDQGGHGNKQATRAAQKKRRQKAANNCCNLLFVGCVKYTTLAF